MHADRRFRTGRQETCEDCRTKSDRERRRAQRWLHRYRRRARKYGIVPVWERLQPGDLIARWGDRCVYCPKGHFEQIDHIVPVGAGGAHVINNVVPCCRVCNLRKASVQDHAAIKHYRRELAAV
jgi:5-methylcytosine-specific restriction endonuclease McrA